MTFHLFVAVPGNRKCAKVVFSLPVELHIKLTKGQRLWGHSRWCQSPQNFHCMFLYFFDRCIKRNYDNSGRTFLVLRCF